MRRLLERLAACPVDTAPHQVTPPPPPCVVICPPPRWGEGAGDTALHQVTVSAPPGPCTRPRALVGCGVDGVTTREGALLLLRPRPGRCLRFW